MSNEKREIMWDPSILDMEEFVRDYIDKLEPETIVSDDQILEAYRKKYVEIATTKAVDLLVSQGKAEYQIDEETGEKVVKFLKPGELLEAIENI